MLDGDRMQAAHLQADGGVQSYMNDAGNEQTGRDEDEGEDSTLALLLDRGCEEGPELPEDDR